MVEKGKKPKPLPSPTDDLAPRGNLPGKPTIKRGAGFGDDIPRKKPVKIIREQSPQSYDSQAYNPFRYTPISTRAGEATNSTDYIKQGIASGLKPGTEKFSNYIANMPIFTKNEYRRQEQEKADEGMRRGGKVKSGDFYRRAADGIASKGKTKGHVVKMASGGIASSYRRAADGIATKGKTKGKMVKMMRGGMC